MRKEYLHPLECERLNAASGIIRGAVQDSIESSIELGSNAKRRCTFGNCRKPAIEGSEYCREHKDLLTPLQESINKDATTVTYKKTYRFTET